MKIVTIIGARPQFIKAAALSKVLKERNIEEILLHTGQHYDQNMSQVFFDELGIDHPKYNLNIGSDSHAKQTAKMMIGIEEVLLEEKPDCVVLFGDTNSTLAGAVVAAKLNIPIAHIEAGLRCFLRYVPEEQNRIVADHLSTYNFTPSENGYKWLAAEGITENVYNFGDIMVDILLNYRDIANSRPLNYYLSRVRSIDGKELTEDILNKGWYFSTIHRQENTDSPEKIENIFEALNSLDLPVVLPLHPRTRHLVDEEGLKSFDNIFFIEPLSYVDTIFFSGNAKLVVTDSGGLHKECYVMKVPSVVIAKNSCWAETFNGGWAILASPDKNNIINAVKCSSPDSAAWSQCYGDGHAASHIVDILLNSTAKSDRNPEYVKKR